MVLTFENQSVSFTVLKKQRRKAIRSSLGMQKERVKIQQLFRTKTTRKLGIKGFFDPSQYRQREHLIKFNKEFCQRTFDKNILRQRGADEDFWPEEGRVQDSLPVTLRERRNASALRMRTGRCLLSCVVTCIAVSTSATTQVRETEAKLRMQALNHILRRYNCLYGKS